MSAVLFDLNAVEMTTTSMPVLQFWRIEIYVGNLDV